MRQFFANDFTQDRWRKAALKNAYSLLSKQRFEHAAAFFLLGGKLWDAVDVCMCRLNDIQLAMVLTRLYEGDNGLCYKRVLKEHVLGVVADSSCQDPFLRTMAFWLLQDYSCALETLLSNLNSPSNFNPSIFNFYFYLRCHPLLLRQKLPSNPYTNHVTNVSTSHNLKGQCGIGNDPLTSLEQILVFNTAYYHLNNGSPLLALTVLSKLPKSESLNNFTTAAECSLVNFGLVKERKLEVDEMNQPLTVLEHNPSCAQSDNGSKINDAVEFDWSRTVSSQLQCTTEFDWSKPVSGQVDSTADSEFDWSQPVFSQLSDTLEFEGVTQCSSVTVTKIDETAFHSSCESIFVHSLAEQLQYNALLSILTEELSLIHLSACCEYIWKSKGNVVSSRKGIAHQSITDWFKGEPLEHVLVKIQRKIVQWLKNESLVVKEVCGIEIGMGSSTMIPSNRVPHAGYDLLTTLFNYVSLHANTSPNMLVVQTELLHLMNTLLPWSTGLFDELVDSDLVTGQSAGCAINPVQLPLLSSCSLPMKHPLNMALNIRLMSSSIFASLCSLASPPTPSKPLDNIDQVFDLCCALSHCLHLCLNPMRLSQETPLVVSTGGDTNTFTRKRLESGGNMLDILSTLDSPNTKPSKWPGLEEWPQSLLSDDGKEASPLCLVLMEAFVVVYCGLLSVAWSLHSIYDILILVANSPTSKKWYDLFGGGATVDLPDQKKTASIMQRVSSIRKLLKQTVSQNTSGAVGLFVSPKESLLHYFLSKVIIFLL